MLGDDRVIRVGILDIERHKIAFKQRQSAKAARRPTRQNQVGDLKPGIAYACRREGNPRRADFEGGALNEPASRKANVVVSKTFSCRTPPPNLP